MRRNYLEVVINQIITEPFEDVLNAAEFVWLSEPDSSTTYYKVFLSCCTKYDHLFILFLSNLMQQLLTKFMLQGIDESAVEYTLTTALVNKENQDVHTDEELSSSSEDYIRLN